jgi:hypothetical protein
MKLWKTKHTKLNALTDWYTIIGSWKYCRRTYTNDKHRKVWRWLWKADGEGGWELRLSIHPDKHFNCWRVYINNFFGRSFQGDYYPKHTRNCPVPSTKEKT